jgi:hypothetical protein
MNFNDFLTELNLTEDEYIQAIQSTLEQPTIFLKRKLSHIWNNSFSKGMSVMWNENIDAQYVLNAYLATLYCTLYMTKVDKSMTSAFRRIRKKHEKSHVDTMQMIHTLGNTLLNLQQMSTQQAIHIALSLPLNCSSRKCVFINTSPLEKHTFVLKPPSLLEQEPDNSEDVLCRSIIDYYLQHPSPIKHICLAKFVSHYKKNGAPISKRKKRSVIRFVKYNKHTDYENYCREKLLLYVSFDQNENTLKHNFPTWEVVYIAYETTVQTNESRFTYNVNPTWDDLESAVHELENPEFTNRKTIRTLYDSYDLQANLPCPRAVGNEKRINLGFQVTKHHFLIENNEYYRVKRVLNREQQAILKDTAIKKRLNMHTHVHLFLIGGARTCKTFIAKALFQMLIRIYDSNNSSDPMKPKGIIVECTGNYAYNAGVTIVHSTFFMPFNKSQFLPLDKEILDTLSKLYDELQLVFIDEASLIGSCFLYSIDNRLRNIKHVHTKYFGNIDMILCGDLYQVQPIQDSLIFEQPMVNMQTMTHDF